VKTFDEKLACLRALWEKERQAYREDRERSRQAGIACYWCSDNGDCPVCGRGAAFKAHHTRYFRPQK
jgi:hypothetical protein